MSRRKQLKPKNLSLQDGGSLGGEEEKETRLPSDHSRDGEGSSGAEEESNPRNDGLSHRCAYCPQSFLDLSELAQHEQVHALLMPYQCRHCGKGFKHKRSQDRHEQLHTGNKKHKCHHCQAAFFRSDHLKLHLKTHDSGRGSSSGSGSDSGSPYAPGKGNNAANSHRCSVCAALFSSPESLLRHLDKEHPSLGHHPAASSSPSTPSPITGSAPMTPPTHSSSSSLTCRLCNASLPDVQALQEHTLQAHTVKDVATTASHRRPSNTNSASDPRYPCDHCHRSFDSILALHSHINSAHPNSEALKTEKCPHCNTNFSNKLALLAHIQAEHTAPGITCPVCANSLESQAALDAHLVNHFLQSPPKLSCTACLVEVEEGGELERHQLKEHVARLLKCLLCGTTTGTEEEMVKHLGRSHRGGMSLGRDWRCRSCNAAFDSEAAFRVHVDVVHLHRQPSAAASPLQLPFPVPGAAFLAARSPPALAHPAFRCSLCGEAFNVEFLFERHLEEAHGGSQPYAFPPGLPAAPSAAPSRSAVSEPSPRKAPETPSSLNFPSASDAQLKCNICDVTEDSPDALRQHRLSHCKIKKTDKCHVCHRSLEDKVAFLRHTAVHAEEGAPVACIVCRQSLSSPAELQLHAEFHIPGLAEGGPSPGLPSDAVMKEEVETKPYQCIKCQVSFASEAEIQSHVITAHVIQEGLENQCNLCSQVLDSPAKLQCHLIEHCFAGCSEYRCYLCNSVFSMAQPLREHILSHPTSAKPYECSDCNLRFFFRSELQHHLLTHRSGKGNGNEKREEREHHCPHCPKSFASLSALQGHSHVHMGSSTSPSSTHPCSQCSKTFASAAKLRAHARLHVQSGDEAHLHSCPLCAKAFSRRDNLKAHMRLHGNPSDRLDLPTMVPFSPREGITS